MPISRLKPAAPKHSLIAVAGLMWSGVGVMLCWLAYGWFVHSGSRLAVPLALISAVAAAVVYRFGFIKIARKNIDRLCRCSEKVCFFAFQAWKSYVLIAVMITLGITLRHSPLPKHYLAVIYETIGGALFFSSFHYYTRLWRVVVLKKTCLLDDPKA